MPKRAERRHHEERVKEKFKKVVKEQTKWMQDPARRDWKMEGGKRVIRNVIDRTLPVKRMGIIEKQGAKMAHHPRHDCEMCRLGIKEEKHKHEFEVEKKAPLDLEDDDE